MNDTTQKIVAVAAWEEIIKRKLKYDLGDRAQFDSDCIAIIKSAILKAVEDLQTDLVLAKQMVSIESKRANLAESRAALASEPWTEETVLEITENLLGVKPTRKARKAIADAHNATLQPAHASEKWTVESVKKLVGVQALRIDYTRIAKRIADAHNATLQPAHASETTSPSP